MKPKILYKYVVPERLDVFRDRRIRFTQPCYLNDPFEFKPGMPGARDEDRGVLENWLIEKRGPEHRQASRSWGILSLTEKNDSIPMWTHYASAHTGFVVGFNLDSDPFRTAIEKGRLRKVRYDVVRPNLTRGKRLGAEIYWTKSNCWEYEREWRWIENRGATEYSEVVRTNGQLLFLRSVPPESICEIILGCRTDPGLEESIRTLRETGDYGRVSLFNVALHESEYKLQIVSISSNS